MVEKILTASGVQHRQTRFLKPPAGTYAVYMDDVETDGPDGIPCIFHHDVTVEVYAPTPGDAAEAEAAIERELTAAGLHWKKQSRHWLQDEQRYQIIYEFTYTVKRRI
jgi:hypothetical protein